MNLNPWRPTEKQRLRMRLIVGVADYVARASKTKPRAAASKIVDWLLSELEADNCNGCDVKNQGAAPRG